MKTKTYTKELVALDRLIQEIIASDITIALDYSGTTMLGDQLTITFKDDLSTEEWDVCDSLVAAHNGEPLLENVIQKVALAEVPVVKPTVPKNEFSLKPYGVCHTHINAANQVFDITLSDKDDKTYSYSCSVIPSSYDCIFQNHSMVRDGVYFEDNGTITTFYGACSEGAAKLSKPINIDYHLWDDDFDMLYLWGSFISAKDFGEDDLVKLQIVDKDGVGIVLGWYTQEQFEAMGSLFVVKEYDECWVNQLDKLTQVLTPDGAPGEIPKGLYTRVKYYPKDETKTDIKIWVDYIVTVKDGA